MTSKEKVKFRSSKVWKNFRKYLMEQRGAECELCGTVYSGKRKRMLQVHHLDPDNYTDLNPKKFKLICSRDHDLIERIIKKILAKKSNLKRKSIWLLLLQDFLTIKARKKLEEDVDNGE